MLILSRKEGQSLRIGDNITVLVARISGGQVKIGIEAPRDTVVLRSELKPERKDGKDAPSNH